MKLKPVLHDATITFSQPPCTIILTVHKTRPFETSRLGLFEPSLIIVSGAQTTYRGEVQALISVGDFVQWIETRKRVFCSMWFCSFFLETFVSSDFVLLSMPLVFWPMFSSGWNNNFPCRTGKSVHFQTYYRVCKSALPRFTIGGVLFVGLDVCVSVCLSACWPNTETAESTDVKFARTMNSMG